MQHWKNMMSCIIPRGCHFNTLSCRTRQSTNRIESRSFPEKLVYLHEIYKCCSIWIPSETTRCSYLDTTSVSIPWLAPTKTKINFDLKRLFPIEKQDVVNTDKTQTFQVTFVHLFKWRNHLFCYVHLTSWCKRFCLTNPVISEQLIFLLTSIRPFKYKLNCCYKRVQQHLKPRCKQHKRYWQYLTEIHICYYRLGT